MTDVSGVFVVGMHSGGTSAIAGALTGLGLGGPIDPPDPSHQHPHGICESPRMWQFNQQLLEKLGSDSQVGMPGVTPLAEAWTDDPRIADCYAEGAALLADAFPRAPWAVKDPRLCVTLPFWRRVVDDDAAAVLVVRNPGDAVKSYEDWLEPEAANRLAWWEYYMRRAVRDLAGMPVLVTHYEQALANPREWCDGTAGWLEGLGVKVTAVHSGATFLDAGARKHASEDLSMLPEGCRQLYVALRAAPGTSSAWDPLRVG